MKRILISMLVVLAVFSISLPSFASTGAYAIRWTQCTGVQIKANYELSANIGSPSLAISWQAPTWSNELSLYCTRANFYAVEMSAFVNIGSPYVPITSSYSINSNSNTVVLTLQVKHCVWTGHIEQCGNPVNHPFNYGDTISVSFTVVFLNSYGEYTHGETDTLRVTS